MAKSVRINDETDKAFIQIVSKSGNSVSSFLEKASEITKQTAPVRVKDGGNHRSLIGWKQTGRLKGLLFSASNYGAYLEFGTSKMAARPHFRPAIQLAIREFQSRNRWR